MRVICPISILILISCGGEPGEPAKSCTTSDQPTFELGTGEQGYGELPSGSDLKMISGPQGGCHFWLAVRTNGFAQRRFEIQYDVLFAETGTTTGSRSRQRVTLNLRDEPQAEGQCEYAGYYAYLIKPWDFRDKEVELVVNVTDDLGRSSSARRKVIARWPDEQPGRDTNSLCGER